MEPERPIEKLLRAHAKKRRDEAGASFELHPADRKVLQAEVERKFAKHKRFPAFLKGWIVVWPRLVWGTAILAVLAIIAFILVPAANKTNSDAFMAQNTPMPAEQPRRELSPDSAPALTEQLGTHSRSSELADLAYKNPSEKSPISETTQSPPLSVGVPVPRPVPAIVSELKQAEPASAPSTGSADGKTLFRPEQGTALAKSYGIVTAPTTIPSETPVPSSALATAESFKRSPDNDRLAFSTKPSLAGSTPAPTVTIATAALSKTDGSNKDSLPAISQRFTQIQLPAKSKMAKLESAPTSAQVLAAFQVQQVGDELRIIDGDGSIYRGRLVAADELRSPYTESKDSVASAGRVQSRERSFQQAVSSVPALQNYSFRVTGTNRSMNQNVIFSGNLAAATNSVLLNVITNSVNTGVNGIQNSAAIQNSNPLSNARISGRAQIGKGKEIPIEAISTP